MPAFRASPGAPPLRERGASKSGVALVVLLLLAYPAYLGVRAVIRAHVDDLIEASHGQPLPEFALKDRGGIEYTTDQLRGKVAVIHFMRSHCPNCERGKPAVSQLAAELGEDEVLWSVMTDAVLDFDEADTIATIERSGFDHPILMADEAFADAFHKAGWAHVTPIAYFANDAGEIVASVRNPQTIEQLRAALAKAKGS